MNDQVLSLLNPIRILKPTEVMALAVKLYHANKAEFDKMGVKPATDQIKNTFLI